VAAVDFETLQGFKTRVNTFMEHNLSKVTEHAETISISGSP